MGKEHAIIERIDNAYLVTIKNQWTGKDTTHSMPNLEEVKKHLRKYFETGEI